MNIINVLCGSSIMQIAMHSLSATMHCSGIAPPVISDCFGLKYEAVATIAEMPAGCPCSPRFHFLAPTHHGNRSINPVSVVTTGHTYCLRQGDHPKVLLNLADRILRFSGGLTSFGHEGLIYYGKNFIPQKSCFLYVLALEPWSNK